jgi:hypothetical protein
MGFELKLQNKKINQLYDENVRLLKQNNTLKRELSVFRDTSKVMASMRNTRDKNLTNSNGKQAGESRGINDQDKGSNVQVHVPTAPQSIPHRRLRAKAHQRKVAKLSDGVEEVLISTLSASVSVEISRRQNNDGGILHMNSKAVEVSRVASSVDVSPWSKDVDAGGNEMMEWLDLGDGLGKMLVPKRRRPPGARIKKETAARAALKQRNRGKKKKKVLEHNDSAMFNFV